MRKFERDAIKTCKAAGLTVLELVYGGKHLKIVCGEGTIVAPSTPSSNRCWLELRALARRFANDQ